MAIQNNPNLYTAGNVVFDSRPATMFYLQSMAHKRAKEEAMDNYFRDLGKNLTPKGMSPDDVPEFISKSNAYKQFAIENRDALRNPSRDNGQALMQANSLYNDALEHSARSIGKVQNISKIPNLNPDERERLMEHGWNAMQQATLPVSDPNYRPFSPSDINYNPAQYTGKDEADFISNITKNRIPYEEKTFGETNPKTFLRKETTRKVYTPEAFKGIAEDAAKEYNSNASFKQEFDKLFNGSFNEKTGQIEISPEYNEAFKQVYGKDIHHPQELAAGYFLNKIQKESIKTEDVEDKFAQAKYMEDKRQAGRVALFNKKKDAAKLLRKGDSGWVNPYIEGVIQDAESRLPGEQGQSLYKESPLINDPLISKALIRNGVEPDVIRYKDGKLEPIYYQRYLQDDQSNKGAYAKGDIIKDAKGNPQIIETLSKPISIQQAKALLLNVAPNTKLDAMEMGMIFGEDEGGGGDELGFEWK